MSVAGSATIRCARANCPPTEAPKRATMSSSGACSESWFSRLDGVARMGKRRYRTAVVRTPAGVTLRNHAALPRHARRASRWTRRARQQASHEETGSAGTQKAEPHLGASLDEALRQAVGGDLPVGPRAYRPGDHGGHSATHQLAHGEQQDVRRQRRRSDDGQQGSSRQPDQQHCDEAHQGRRYQAERHDIGSRLIRVGKGMASS